MASSHVPEPTLVLYKSNMCRHCQNLTNIWDSVTATLKSVYPKLRFYVLTAKDNTGKFDENTAPKDIIRFSRWFPMIFLVPGRTWDAAMANLGPKNPIEIKDGVQIMNARWDGNDIKYDQKYDIRKPEEFAKWLKDAMENKDFKRVQYGESVPSTIVPVVSSSTSSQPIQPYLSNIVRPANSQTAYVAAGESARTGLIEFEGDVCRMKIISRPR